MSPDWCGSVGWALCHRLKGGQFHSWSGHTPRLWARSPVAGLRVGGNLSMDLFRSFSLPTPFLKMNKATVRRFHQILQLHKDLKITPLPRENFCEKIIHSIFRPMW